MVVRFSPAELASLTPDQLPEKVMLIAEVIVTDPVSEVTMKIPAGNRVKVVRIEGSNVVVSPGEGPYSGALPIANTDLMEQLATRQAVAVTAPLATEPTASEPVATPAGDSAEPATAPATDPATAPATDPAMAPTTDPASAAEPATTPTTEPAAEPATEPTPTITPAPIPAPAVARVAGAGNSVVKIMQTSIRNGQIKEFAFNQVLGWKAEANETVDGEVYQTGTVAYKAETIFGVKTIQAKALIKGGKVKRWIWPKSGMEIK